MGNIELNHDNVKSCITDKDLAAMQGEVDNAHAALESGRGAGSDFLGWLHLPSRIAEAEMHEVEQAAAYIRENAEVFICIGIGGSYLGAKAAIDFLSHTFYNQFPREKRRNPEVYFAGHNISSDYLSDLLELIEGKDVCLNVISKSGTTTEPALAFRVLKQALEKKYGVAGARKRIFAATDKAKGALKKLADKEGYKTFVIPDDVGGRFSVLTPVGLLPIAAAGLDIRDLIAGARVGEEAASKTSSLDANISYRYAAIRNMLYRKGKTLEVLASFHPSLKYVLDWWKQLSGESEGKGGRGIFPASVEYTTDLHSLGQWVQDGTRIIFETFLLVNSSTRQMQVPRFENDDDDLNYLAGQSLDYVNDKAYRGTAMAHLEGNVPNMTLTLKDRSPRTLGELFYFFERAVAMSGYLLGVNPFDQPGVEFYKRNMFILLNKPGFGKGR